MSVTNVTKDGVVIGFKHLGCGDINMRLWQCMKCNKKFKVFAKWSTADKKYVYVFSGEDVK